MEGPAAQVSPSGSFIRRVLQMCLSRYNIWTLGQMSSDVRNAGQRSAGRHKPPSTLVSLRLSPLHALFSFLCVDVISCSAASPGNSKCRCLCQRRKCNCFSLCLFVFFGPYFTSLPAERQNRGAHCWVFCLTLLWDHKRVTELTCSEFMLENTVQKRKEEATTIEQNKHVSAKS